MKGKSTLNSLIPELLKKSEDYTKAIKKRIKAHTIFSEFESKATNHFMNYVTDSNSRYKEAKSGNRLSNIITSSKSKNIEHASHILNDNFFTRLNLDKEKERMRMNVDPKILLKINEFITRIRSSTDILPRKQSAKSRFSDTSLPSIAKPQENKYVLNESPENAKQSETQDNNTSLLKESIELPPQSPTEIMQSILEQDQKTFEDNMADYNLYLSELKSSANDDDVYDVTKGDIERPYHVYHLPENLRMLSYKNNPIVETKKVVPPRITINMRKMLKFSRLGKNVVTLKNDNMENELEEYVPKEGMIRNKSYGNTMELVRTEANNGMYIDDKFNEKERRFEMNIFNSEALPKLEEYETIVRRKRISENNYRTRRIRRTTIRMDDALLDPEEKLLRDIISKKNKYQQMRPEFFVTSSHITEGEY